MKSILSIALLLQCCRLFASSPAIVEPGNGLDRVPRFSLELAEGFSFRTAKNTGSTEEWRKLIRQLYSGFHYQAQGLYHFKKGNSLGLVFNSARYEAAQGNISIATPSRTAKAVVGMFERLVYYGLLYDKAYRFGQKVALRFQAGIGLQCYYNETDIRTDNNYYSDYGLSGKALSINVGSSGEYSFGKHFALGAYVGLLHGMLSKMDLNDHVSKKVSTIKFEESNVGIGRLEVGLVARLSL